MSNLNMENVKKLVNKMTQEFKKSTGLTLNTKKMLDAIYKNFRYYEENSLKLTNREMDLVMLYQYKKMYKEVLLAMFIENKDFMQNPEKLVPPAMDEKNYNEENEKYLKRLKSTITSAKMRYDNAAKEYEGMMTTLFEKIYSPMMAYDESVPFKGDLRADDILIFVEAAHMNYAYKQVEKRQADILIKNINTLCKTIGEGISSMKEEGVAFDYYQFLTHCDHHKHYFKEEVPTSSKIAATYSILYTELKKLHDDRNGLSKFFHFAEKNTMANVRRQLKSLLPEQKLTDNDCDKLLSDTAAKESSFAGAMFENIAYIFENLKEDESKKEKTKYQELTKDIMAVKKECRDELDLKDIAKMEDSLVETFCNYTNGEMKEKSLTSSVHA